jgi:hypothetical protein
MTQKNYQEWISVALLLVGATLLALNISSTKWAFPILASARLWLTIIMYKKKDHPMLVMNFFYFIVDIIGMDNLIHLLYILHYGFSKHTPN